MLRICVEWCLCWKSGQSQPRLCKDQNKLDQAEKILLPREINRVDIYVPLTMKELLGWCCNYSSNEFRALHLIIFASKYQIEKGKKGVCEVCTNIILQPGVSFGVLMVWKMNHQQGSKTAGESLILFLSSTDCRSACKPLFLWGEGRDREGKAEREKQFRNVHIHAASKSVLIWRKHCQSLSW